MVSEQINRTKTSRLTEQARRLVWLTEAQAALGWGVILILLALLGAIYLNQASHIAGVGRRVQNLQIQLDNVKRQNFSLEKEIAESQSLDRLESEARRLGFRRARPQDIEYVIVPNYPVAAVVTTPVAPTLIEPVETLSEALWMAFKAGASNLILGEAP
jgi:cell division protein FtsL